MAVLFYLKPGDHIVAGDDIYGGTYRLFNAVLSPMGFNFSFINMRDLGLVKKSVTSKTKMIWIETPSNPLMKITDLAAVATVEQRHARAG